MTNQTPDYVTARQRARNNTSGVNVARVLRGQAPAREKDEVQPSTGRRHTRNPQHDNFASPREFLSGPQQPPHQTSGIRRNPTANKDSVGFMLTDEYLMAGNNANGGAPASATPSYGAPANATPSYGAPARRGQGATRQRDAHRATTSANAKVSAPGGYRDGLTNNCIVTAPEKQWRSGVRVIHAGEPMDAPYFEDTDPRPPRDAPAVTGKRHVRNPYKDAKMFGQVPPPKEGEEDEFQNALPPCRKTANKANESVDVLNLYCYSADELNEKPQPHKQLGPRKYVAPDMPPRRHPMIHPINTPAKQEHDVLGNGRWGVPEKHHPTGLGRGLCRPPRDTANLFRGGDAPRQEKREEPRRESVARGSADNNSSRRGSTRSVEPFRVQPVAGNTSPRKRPDPVFTDADRPHKILSKRHAGSPNLLRYYDPSVDTAPSAAAPHPHGNRSNEETRERYPSEIHPTCKGRGACANAARSTISLSYN